MIRLIVEQQNCAPICLEIPECWSESLDECLIEVEQLLTSGSLRVLQASDEFAVRQRQRWEAVIAELRDLLLSPEHCSLLQSMPVGSTLTVAARQCWQRIPWEALPVPRPALGVHFAIVRRLLTVGDTEFLPRVVERSGAERLRGTACVAAADGWQLISVNLEQVLVERRLRNLLVADGRVSPINPSPQHLTVTDFQRILSENVWLHFAGHAAEGSAGRCGRELVLASSRLPGGAAVRFGPQHLHGGQRSPQALFLNACGALHLPETSGDAPADSLVWRLLHNGASIVVGAVVEVGDSLSRHLVSRFYDSLATGASVGEALRQGRLAAAEKRGTLSLLPWAYVAYADPHYRPFPVPGDDSVATERGTTDEPQREQTTTGVSEADYPRVCEYCHAEIRTRHGDYGTPASGSRCRKCGHAGGAAADDSGRAGAQIRGMQPAVQLAEAEQVFCEWLEETLQRDWPCQDPSRSQPVTGRFSPLAPVATSISRPAEVISCERRELRDPQQTLLETVCFLMIRSALPCDSQVSAAVLGYGAVTTPGALLVIVSDTGFSEQFLQQFQEPVTPEWYPAGASVILWEPRQRREHRRRFDLRSLAFPPMLSRPSSSLQLSDAVSRLTLMLPLAASLSAREMAIEWQIELDAVESAMKLVAMEHRLRLDQHAEFGLVLSPQELLESPSGASSRPRTELSDNARTGSAVKSLLQRLQLWKK